MTHHPEHDGIDVEAVLAPGNDEEALWQVWRIYWLRHDIQTTMINRGTNTGNDLLRQVGEKRLAELPSVSYLQALQANRLLRERLERNAWWPLQWARTRDDLDGRTVAAALGNRVFEALRHAGAPEGGSRG